MKNNDRHSEAENRFSFQIRLCGTSKNEIVIIINITRFAQMNRNLVPHRVKNSIIKKAELKNEK